MSFHDGLGHSFLGTERQKAAAQLSPEVYLISNVNAVGQISLGLADTLLVVEHYLQTSLTK